MKEGTDGYSPSRRDPVDEILDKLSVNKRHLRQTYYICLVNQDEKNSLLSKREQSSECIMGQPCPVYPDGPEPAEQHSNMYPVLESTM